MGFGISMTGDDDMRKYNTILLMFFMVAAIVFTPSNASAAVLKKGSRGNQVKEIQSTLKDLGYFTYKKTTGYYGSITVNAVKKFQKDQGIASDGIVGRQTITALKSLTGEVVATKMMISEIPSNKKGDLNWFSTVRYVLKRGDVADIIDVDTGKTFQIKRSYGSNHADVEPLTKADTAVIKELWNGWSWKRRAVVVQVDGYVIAGSLAAMPHAGKDSARAGAYVSGRSGGYGRGQNLDAVKNNGANGVLDLHFKGSKTHGSNSVNKAHQSMVAKANKYIEKNY